MAPPVAVDLPAPPESEPAPPEPPRAPGATTAPTTAVGAGAALRAEGPSAQRIAAAIEAQKLFESGFRGENTDEVARMMEDILGKLLQQDPRQGGPRIADLLGGRAAIEFAAHRYPEAEKQVRRMLAFARAGRDDMLFMLGMRKTLAAAAFRQSSRSHEVEVMDKLRDELASSPGLGGKAQLEERLLVALLDCIGTGYMLDGLQPQALAKFREARARSETIFEQIEAPSRLVHLAVSAGSRIFPRAGLVAAYTAKGDLEQAAEASDELIPLVGSLVEAGVLPEGHPAREAAEGSIDALRETYAQVQAARKARGEKDLPATLEERLKRKAHQGLEPGVAGPAEPSRPGPFAPR